MGILIIIVHLLSSCCFFFFFADFFFYNLNNINIVGQKPHALIKNDKAGFVKVYFWILCPCIVNYYKILELRKNKKIKKKIKLPFFPSSLLFLLCLPLLGILFFSFFNFFALFLREGWEGGHIFNVIYMLLNL